MGPAGSPRGRAVSCRARWLLAAETRPSSGIRRSDRVVDKLFGPMPPGYAPGTASGATGSYFAQGLLQIIIGVAGETEPAVQHDLKVVPLRASATRRQLGSSRAI